MILILVGLVLFGIAALYERAPVEKLREVVPNVGLDELPRPFLLALLMAEDRHFFLHRGFDWREMRIAIADWWLRGARLRGASTISQQLMKNFFLTPERTLRRKLREALYTVKLERRLTKEEILALYLNRIEWGNGVYGIRDAARHYFAKAPSDLDTAEVLFLIAIIPRPRFSGEPPEAVWRTFRALATYYHALLETAPVRSYLAGRLPLRALDLKVLQFAGDGEARKVAARPSGAEMVARFRARSYYVRHRRNHSMRG